VADHCHLSGIHRQTLCNGCNLKMQTPNVVPCFLYNLTNYNAHFIMTELEYDTKTILVILNNEKFISFSKHISRDLHKIYNIILLLHKIYNIKSVFLSRRALIRMVMNLIRIGTTFLCGPSTIKSRQSRLTSYCTIGKTISVWF
jgi:hypothetical protein